ncbi:hypothetical protein YGS_C1P0988 [Sphingobium sp. YG1]|nr:hypothetical protein YGS_C1P0988 [Sphingobium sp. YG1]
MADDRRTTQTGRAMRSDQGRRVQFEMTGRIGSDVGGRDDRLYPIGAAEQQAAHLVPVRCGQGHDLFQQRS